jgi:asparagine synthase (glutamine-hydrolysing)
MGGGFLVVIPHRWPLAPDLVRQLLKASEPRGPHGISWTQTPSGVLLAQSWFHPSSAPSSTGTVRCNATPQLRAVRRGEILNRSELAETLNLGSLPSDSELLVRAYGKWGPRMVDHVVGELSFALWDEKDERLIVARDHLGTRPAVFHASDKYFATATEPSQLLPLPSISLEPDLVAVADRLSGYPSGRSRTLFRDIGSLDFGELLVLERRRYRRERYWLPRWAHPDSEATPAELAPGIRAAAMKAVEERLPPSGKVACSLSGGLDSSAIAAMACDAITRTSPDVSAYLFSFIYPQQACDESPYITSVVEQLGLPWTSFDGMATRPRDMLDPAQAFAEEIRYPVEGATVAFYRCVDWFNQEGIRIHLTGDGGDGVFWSAPPSLQTLIQLKTGRRKAIWWSSGQNVRVAARKLRRVYARPLIPTPLINYYLALKGNVPDQRLVTDRALRLASRAQEESLIRDRVTRELVDGLASASLQQGVISGDSLAIRLGYELRNPLLDVRLVDLALSGSPLLHLWHGEWRSLQKAAFAPIYPPEISARRDKAEFSVSTAIYFNELCLPRRLQLADMGMIDENAFRERVARISSSITAPGNMAEQYQAWAIIGLERWLASL